MDSDADRERERHPSSPRGPELRDPVAFLRAVRGGLPPDHGAFADGFTAQLVLDVDAAGDLTSARAVDATDPVVGRVVIAAMRATGFTPAQRDGVAHAIGDHRMKVSVRTAALRV